ncbi:MAG: hypothetical protein WBF53_10125 [Litorimonas sp.]
MAYLGIAPAQRNEQLFPAGFALLVTGLVSAVDIRLFGQSWPLTWLPFAVVALWPRNVGALPSALLLFAGGIWVDWTSWGAPGQWPLIFLLTYAIMPSSRSDAMRGLAAGMGRFVGSLFIGVPVLIATGWVVYDTWPDWGALARGLVVAVVILPFAILLRDRLAGRMSGDD